MKLYSSEQDLWGQVLEGDNDACEYLYSTYVQQMFNYGIKFGCNTETVEDCIQEVFVNIIEKRKNLTRNTHVKMYLFKSLRLEIWRKMRNEKSRVVNQDLEFLADFTIDQKIMEDEIQMIRVYEINKVLNELPRRQKEAIYLRYYEGLSYQEISTIMETEQSSSYKIIYKAIDTLYQKLSLKKGKLFY